MKKHLLTASILITLSLNFTSCKKVYQCECTRIINGEDWNPIITNVPIEDKKKNAETSCQSLGYTFGWDDYQTCKIK